MQVFLEYTVYILLQFSDVTFNISLILFYIIEPCDAAVF